MTDDFERQLKAAVAQVVAEIIVRAATDLRIGPGALLKQHGRARKFPLGLFLELYLCPPSRTVAAAMFGEPGWVISGEERFKRLPEEGLPDQPDEVGYGVLLDILAERVIS